MKNSKITNEQIIYNYENFTSNLIPFGSADIREAIITSLAVGEDGDWAAEKVREFSDSCDIKIEDCDPVYCVYDTILQEARNEIDGLINFNFFNDGAEIYTNGNFCATSYDWSDEAPETIKDKLIEAKIVFKDLSEKTQWFLEKIAAQY
jgi:hypothetical protein